MSPDPDVTMAPLPDVVMPPPPVVSMFPSAVVRPAVAVMEPVNADVSPTVSVFATLT